MGSGEIRVPKQNRSLQKKELIKSAAIELIGSKGYYNTTTNEIAKKAGVSIGTLYSYYRDKESIFDEVQTDLYMHVMNKVKAVKVPDNLSEFEKIKIYIKLISDEHMYMKDFQLQAHALSMQDKKFHAMEEKNHSYVREVIISIINQNKQNLDISDVQITALLIQNIIEATVHELVFFECGYDRDNVINELATMICRYVLYNNDK